MKFFSGGSNGAVTEICWLTSGCVWSKSLFILIPEWRNHNVKCQKADWNLHFSQGCSRRVWFFIPWPMQGQVTVRTSVKRNCWSCVPLESSFPEKGRKISTPLWASEWSQYTEGENGCSPWKEHGLPCQPSHREMAPWVLLVPLQTVVHLCTALSLCTAASACLITLEGEEAPQGGVVRGRDTHCISLPFFN